MKKIFTFVAAALMALNVFAATETVLDVNFAEFASEQIGTLGGSNITPTFGEQVSKMNTNVYSLSVTGLLDADKIFINRNSDVLLRYADIRTIGLYSKSTPTVVIPDLKANDIVEIAWNAGGKSDGTYWEIDSTLTSLGNVEVTGDWGEYAFSHTSGGTERTINYTTRQLKVTADGDVRFAIPSVKGDGANWKLFLAYIKVTRSSDEEPGDKPTHEPGLAVNYSELTVANIAYGDKIDLTRNTNDKNKVNGTDMYPFTAGAVLGENDVLVSRGDGMLRYADVRNIGLFNNNKNFYGIKNLKAGDIVEIAYNGGGNSDGTMKDVPAMTDTYNFTISEETGTYTLDLLYEEQARTLDYTVYSLTVTEDGAIAFALQAAYVAYIKVNPEAEEPGDEPVEETNYYLKNNWDLGEWAWKEMSKDGEVYKLENVVFGGSGVNLNTAASDENSAWIPVADIKGDAIQAKDTVTLTLAISETDTVLTATLIGRPEQEEPEDVKYYLTGTVNEWATADENYLFVANESTPGEFMLTVTLAEGDGIKVVSSTGTWYPDGMGNEYTVDAAHTGVNTIYFRPDGQGGEGWYNGFFYLETTSPEGVENANAKSAVIKAIENGKVVILRDGVRYNVLGAKL